MEIDQQTLRTVLGVVCEQFPSAISKTKKFNPNNYILVRYLY